MTGLRDDRGGAARTSVPALAPGLAMALGLATALSLALALAGSPGEAAYAAAAEQRVTVQAITLEAVPLQRRLSAIGTLESPADTAITPAVAGRIIAIDFSPGSVVAEGTILARLDDTTASAAFKAAAAEQANALAVFQHDEKLLPLGGVSAEQALSDASALDTAEADLAKAKALLDETQIKAPFTGAIGFPEASLGALIEPGQAIARIVKLDPLLVRFSLSQQDMGAVHVGERVELTAPGLAGRVGGQITALGQTLDPELHTLRVEAAVPNGASHLKPGMFVDVEVVVGGAEKALLIPAQAVVPMGGATLVWCVGPDGRAVRKSVTLGRYRQTMVEVMAGLKPGDRVITAGQQRLEAGVALRVTPYEPVANPELSPADH